MKFSALNAYFSRLSLTQVQGGLRAAFPLNMVILTLFSYASQVIANFVPDFVAMATGVGRGKCNWQHSMAHPRKPPYRRKNLLRKPSYSPFCPKFRCHANQGGSRVKLNDTIGFAISENHTLELNKNKNKTVVTLGN